MCHKGLFLLFTFTLAVLIGSLAEAQLSGEYSAWEDGPDGFLLTKKERKAWSKIKNDAEAQHFVEIFWARRNPEANNPFNAFKAEYEQRIRVADANFGYKNRRGALTDRGKVLLLLGQPGNIQRGAVSQEARNTGASPTVDGLDSDSGTAEYWFYDPAGLPEGFETKAPQLVFIFQENRLGSGEFTLDRSRREGMMGVQLLHDAPEVYLRHPGLQEVPKPVSVAGGKAAPAAHLAWLGKGEAPYNESAKIIVESGVMDEVSRPLWVHIELPSEAPTLDLFVGQVKSVNSEVLSTFEVDATPIQGQTGKAYHLGFPLAPGTYTVEIAGATGGEPQVTREIEAEISSIVEEGTWLSPVWIGISAGAEPEAALGSPFDIGGWHLIPISGPGLTRENELVYFGYLVRPGTDESGGVKIKAQIRVKRDGKQLGKPFSIPLEASQVTGGLYMYGNSVGLNGLPEPGSYEFVFKITDQIAEVSVERTISLEVAE